MKQLWYSPNSVSRNYSKNKIIWVIENVFGSDYWPSENRESGYVGKGKRQIDIHANYEFMRMITAEISARLARCGQDGLALEFYYRLSNGDFVDVARRIANYLKVDDGEVVERVKTALSYCCGEERKMETYSEFKNG